MPNPAGECLGDAIQFRLHGGRQYGEPLVINHQGLDLVGRELPVLGADLDVEVFLGLLCLLVGLRLLLDQGQIFDRLVALVLVSNLGQFFELDPGLTVSLIAVELLAGIK